MNELKKSIENEPLKQQAIALKLHGVQRHWQELTQEQLPWLEKILHWERVERQQRSLEHRLSTAKLGRFKPLQDFDWHWPSKIDSQAVHTLMQLDFFNHRQQHYFHW